MPFFHTLPARLLRSILFLLYICYVYFFVKRLSLFLSLRFPQVDEIQSSLSLSLPFLVRS